MFKQRMKVQNAFFVYQVSSERVLFWYHIMVYITEKGSGYLTILN